MGSKTGLAAQLGVGVESSWGTRVAPSRFLEITSESLKLDIQRVESAGLRAGRRYTRGYHENRKGIAGAISGEVPTKGFGLIANHIMGAVATATPSGGTLTRDHTATPGDQDGKSFSIQVGRPDLGGTVRPFDYTGCKIVSAEFANSVDGILTYTLTIDGQDEATDQSLATASYPTGLDQFFFAGAVLKLDDVETDVKDVNFSISNGLKTDRYYLRNSSLKKEQIEDTAPREVTGTFNADFSDMTLYNNFVTGAEAELVALWQNPVEIESGFYPEFEVTLARTRFDGETPNVAGTDVLNQAIPFKALEPASGATASLRVRSSDSAP